jgi:hypothetical protein
LSATFWIVLLAYVWASLSGVLAVNWSDEV